MKYTLEETINAPLDEFIQKMDDPENMKYWQRGLTHYEQVAGTPGEKGAQMKMFYHVGKRKFDLLETVVKRDLPHEFHATYEMPGMYNMQRNYFSKTEDNKTRWVSECEFSSDKLMFKIMMFLFPGQFKKQSKIIMTDLKAFVEDGTSVEGLK